MGSVKEKIVEGARRVFQRRSRQYDLEDFIARQTKRGFTGALQHVDGTPVAPPIGYQPRESIFELVKRQVEYQLSQQAREDQESFEEADDFEIPEDLELPKSPYENDLDPSVKELLAAGRKAIEEKRARSAARTALKDQRTVDEGAPGQADPPLDE